MSLHFPGADAEAQRGESCAHQGQLQTTPLAGPVFSPSLGWGPWTPMPDLQPHPLLPLLGELTMPLGTDGTRLGPSLQNGERFLWSVAGSSPTWAALRNGQASGAGQTDRQGLWTRQTPALLLLSVCAALAMVPPASKSVSPPGSGGDGRSCYRQDGGGTALGGQHHPGALTRRGLPVVKVRPGKAWRRGPGSPSTGLVLSARAWLQPVPVAAGAEDLK